MTSLLQLDNFSRTLSRHCQIMSRQNLRNRAQNHVATETAGHDKGVGTKMKTM